MNPVNKLFFPTPGKPLLGSSPYDRIQSAPPEGKEDDKKNDRMLMEHLKQNPPNINPKKMNINSQVFNHKQTHETTKKVKLVASLNPNASEFKNPLQKPQETVPAFEPQNQKQSTAPNTTMTTNDPRKKFGLKPSSVPFNLATSTPTQKAPTIDSAPNQLNFEPNNSIPKLTNRKSQTKSPLIANNNPSQEEFQPSNQINKIERTDEKKPKEQVEVLSSSIPRKEDKVQLAAIVEEIKPTLAPAKPKQEISGAENEKPQITVEVKVSASGKEIEVESQTIQTRAIAEPKIEEKEAVEKKGESKEVAESPLAEKPEENKEKEKNGEKAENSFLNGKSEEKKSFEEKPPKTNYKEMILSLIQLGRKTKMSNPPAYLLNLIQREFLSENMNVKRQTYKQNQSRRTRDDIKVENDVPIERSQTMSGMQGENHESLFFREPDNKKKSEIKNQLHKWTKHFKDIGKNENIKIQNSIRMNLNILTPDNFAKIKFVIVDLVKTNEEILKTLVDMIIEKAWNEPKYITTYANLCSFLQDEKTLQVASNEKSEDSKKGKNKSIFKSLLLGRIQKAFEKQEFLKGGIETSEEPQKTEKGAGDLKKKKKKVFGNVKFIGQLYLCKVIPLKVISICVSIMLSKFLEDYSKTVSERKREENPEFEDNLEAILILFDQVGKNYEKERGDKEKDKKDKKDGETPERKYIESLKQMILKAEKTPLSQEEKVILKTENPELSTNAIFDLLKFFKNDLDYLSSRLKLLIENLLERREEGWKDKLFSNEGPKRIADLHEEIKKEQEELYKSAMEYKEKHPYDYNKPTKIYQARDNSKQVRVQVAIEKNPKEEEKKEETTYSSNPQNKVKLNFSVNRDAPSKVEPKYTFEEIQIKVKEIFKKLTSENIDKVIAEDLQKLCQKCSHNMLLAVFFDEYANEKISEVEKRIEIPLKLYSEKLVSKEEFLKEFNHFLTKSWEIASDIPFLVTSLAKIFMMFRKQEICKFKDLEIAKSDDYEDILYFFKDFIEETFKLVKLEKKEKEYEGDLLELMGKLSPEEVAWFEKMKSRC